MRSRLLILLSLFVSTLSFAQTVVIYSNDVWGEVEPCGCRKDPKGGFLRKLTLIRRLQKEGWAPLQLDAGNAFFSTSDIPDVLRAQSLVQATYVVESMNLLKQDAFVPGPRDFAGGMDFFLQLKKKAKFSFLASNLVNRKSGKPFLPASVVLKKDGKK